MDSGWVYVAVAGAGLVVVLIAAMQDSLRKRRAAANFHTRYGGSVDRMLVEAAVDHAAIRAIRDADRAGIVRAARLVKNTLNVPLGAAAEFARRV